VPWKKRINDALAKTTGYQLERTAPHAARSGGGGRRRRKLRKADRLVRGPVFVMCTLRSGSTLLRVLLNSHSRIHAPHEIHLRYISVSLDKKWSERSMKEMGLDADGLRYLLWDRLLERELSSSGKSIVVDKTPNNVFIADKLRECWPDARFVFLLRHPAAIAESRRNWFKGDPKTYDAEHNFDLIRRYCEALEDARQRYDGITIRYEELTEDPERVTREICDFLGVEWEPSMLEYGEYDHGRYKSGLGDWSENIKSGEVQKAKPPPPDTPEPLRPIAAKWGYLTEDSPAVRAS
jgi:sulfotransferase family protein